MARKNHNRPTVGVAGAAFSSIPIIWIAWGHLFCCVSSRAFCSRFSNDSTGAGGAFLVGGWCVGTPRLFVLATAGATVQRDHAREKTHGGSSTNKSKRDHHVQRCRSLFSAFRMLLSRRCRLQNVG